MLSRLSAVLARARAATARAEASEPEKPASLWPAAALVAALVLALGVVLGINGFTYAPSDVARDLLLSLWPIMAGLVGVRILVGFALGRRTSPRRLLRSALSFAAGMVVLGFFTAAFGWTKILIPFFNARTWDAELHQLDLLLHFGLDPNLFVMGLAEGSRWMDGAIDWSYSQYGNFLVFSVIWFASHPSLDQRHRFVTGLVLTWTGGLALHLLVPALGPCYAFPDYLPVVAERFPRAHGLMMTLWHNYLNIERVLKGEQLPVNLSLGVAAMPSLHVAYPAYVAAHCIEFRNPLRAAFVAVTLVLLVGSIATGWHYAVDGYVGIVLAALAWLAVRRRPARRLGAAPRRD